MSIAERTEEEKGGIISMEGKEGEEVFLYSILSEDFISKNGLLNVAVAGRFIDNETDSEGNLVVDSFQGNPEFIHLFHEMLDSIGRHSKGLLAKVGQQEEGSWVYIIDQRVKDKEATIAPKDIIGGFKVENGKLGEYAGNPSHVLLTEEGIFQVGAELKEELINLIKSKYKPH
ncbi:MAG: hypothetical protein KAG20_06985 [Cocleimonas sp.]|nr:hypothetical protein [Cocleimonas sp.]